MANVLTFTILNPLHSSSPFRGGVYLPAIALAQARRAGPRPQTSLSPPPISACLREFFQNLLEFRQVRILTNQRTMSKN
ncbi:MAG: hypothetical protein OEV18_14260, partial [Deltaproteobacteria bacterium]|nr:hypothetical protein [Deltaproteobacteria bacterium]